MFLNKSWILFITVLVGAFQLATLSGCARKTFNLSVPIEVPNGVVGEIDQNIIKVKLKQLEFSIEIHNFQPLGVWFAVETMNTQLKLDPAAIHLLTEEGRSYKPVTYLGPADPWVSPRAFLQGCGPRQYSLGWAPSKIDLSNEDTMHGNIDKGVQLTTGGPVPFEGRKCFMFWFDFKPSSEDIFYVSINGISKDGKVIRIPEIKFGSGKVSKSMTVP